MKKKIFLFAGIAMLALSAQGVNAQEKAEAPTYQRSSLHMVLLNTNEPGLTGKRDFSNEITKAWTDYPFPDKYNNHKVDLIEAYGGAPKGSFIELVNKFSGMDISKLGLNEAKDILTQLGQGKEYNKDLLAACDSIIEENKLGQQLVRKWFNIQDDGSNDYNLIFERAAYNASQAEIAQQAATVRGIQAIFDQGDNLIGSTFVTFSKLCFYESEPVAALIRDLTKLVASFDPTGIAGPAAAAAADIAYTATKEGFTARTTTALYQLVWDEETVAKFNSCFEATGKINMEKFNAINFKLKNLGIDSANTLTIDAGAGFAGALGMERKTSEEDLIETTIVRNIDKILAKMQKTYEEFAPVAQIVATSPDIIADMGMKEGLEGGESFNLMEQQFDEKTSKFIWKNVGVLKVDKKGIWDNRFSLTEQPAAEGVQGTVLTGSKKAAPGMLVKMVVKAQKKKK